MAAPITTLQGYLQSALRAPRVAIKLHEVVDVPLGGREDVGGGVGQPVLGHLARRGVHVDRLGAAGRQVAVHDGHGRGVPRLLARLTVEVGRRSNLCM